MENTSYLIIDPIEEKEEMSDGENMRLLFGYDVDDFTRSVLDRMTPREIKVLRLRFGVDGENSHSLEEVAEIFGVSRERIRQIEHKALRRHIGCRRKKLSGYIC